MTSTAVSVVVCTYNRAAMLREALRSLARLRTEPAVAWEIVVVDNASTDDTPAVIAEAAAASPISLRGVREPRPGVASARNRGVAEARGEWIAFFDDDQLADPDWLVELLSMARDKGALCVGGAVRLGLPHGCRRELAPLCRTLLGESAAHEAPRRYTRRSAPGTGNLMIHRAVFERIGTFDESLAQAGEDTDLFRRMRQAGIAAWYTPRAVVFHMIPEYRLSAHYLEWTALRIGSHLARREQQEWGRWLLPVVCLGRVAQGLVAVARGSLRAKWRRCPEAALGARCRRALMEGYVRHAMHLLAPAVFAQREFFARLEFRLERHTLAQ